ncbi:MAG: N-acetyltransferase [Silicimonas sp.]|nr:N-acetyltransferase [Silicimonas sp.]
MTIQAMSIDDLEIVLGWAADEGWNPGLDDAPAFLAADPAGFLIKKVDDEPVAAISVVNHSPKFAFLGLYICKPEHRGHGYGIGIWQAGIAHAGPRTIGLDGVPDQQSNYARSGFVRNGSTIRYGGRIEAASDKRMRPATPTELRALVSRDVKVTGIDRLAFSTAWLSQTPNRNTLVLIDGTNINGFATFRRCRQGVKIGPLQATCEADALSLIASNPFAGSNDPIFVDIQSEGSPFCKLLEKQGFEPTFETARMYKGPPPKADPARYQAIATMELG